MKRRAQTESKTENIWDVVGKLGSGDRDEDTCQRAGGAGAQSQ